MIRKLEFVPEAVDMNSAIPGYSDATIRKTLSDEGPPFFFGSEIELAVGDNFKLVGNVFRVVRIITAEEFHENAGRRKLTPAPSVKVYVEAITE